MLATLIALGAALVAVLGFATNQVLQLDVGTLTLLSGAVVPLLTNLVTKSNASSKVKGLVMLLLSAVAGGLVVATQSGGEVVLDEWIKGMALSFASAYLSYKALWDRFGITEFLYNTSVGDKGIGTAEPAAVDPNNGYFLLGSSGSTADPRGGTFTFGVGPTGPPTSTQD